MLVTARHCTPTTQAGDRVRLVDLVSDLRLWLRVPRPGGRRRAADPGTARPAGRTGAGRDLTSASLGLPRSTTYRLLGALVEQGFVSYLPEERRYGLGVVTFELGSSYSRQMPLRRVAQPVLSRLASTTRENAHLAVLHGPDVYYVIEQRAPAGRPWSVMSASGCPRR